MPADPPPLPSTAPSPCPSCSAPLAGRFCSACGERAFDAGELRLGSFVREWASALTSLDGKVWRTLRLLLTSPGLLADQRCRGARVRTLAPVQLFLLANLIYFLLASTTPADIFTTSFHGHLRGQIYSGTAQQLVHERLGLDASALATDAGRATLRAYAQRFELVNQRNARSLLILLVPLFALLFALLQRGRPRGSAEHLVLATHFGAFFLLYVALVAMWALFLVVAALHIVGLEPPRVVLEPIGTLLIALSSAIWCRRAFVRFYGNSARGALLRALAFASLLLLPFYAYRAVLFGVTFLEV
ncbi:MAG: DUF3667 domain-containing protein [Planctomycetes bacterium]|nr:DUF3667 domain-containing protein [Planctomycetota bacterium]